MMLKMYMVFAATALLVGCASLKVPDTLGDPNNANNYGYHPLDPLPVEIMHKDTVSNAVVLKALPDETMRIAIGKFNKEGGLSFGTSNVGYEGNHYVLILDYIKYTTNTIGVTLKDSLFELNTRNPDLFIPVYVGVGLRLTANIHVTKGKVDLGDLFAIGAAASSEKISGTLVLQTLGISGESVSATIPFPSEINNNSIQNAILALGAIKAKIYDPKTVITPRIVGVYNTLGGGTNTINSFISNLLKDTQLLDITKYQ
jgi:hypothetical protein